MNTNNTMKRTWKSLLSLVITLILILGSLQATRGNVQFANKFLIYDGRIKYEDEYYYRQYVAEDDIEWAIRIVQTEEITVTNLDPETVQFSKKITFKILDAYQQVGGIKYDPESYGFAYTDEENNVLEWFDDTDSHTARFVRDVSKTTGMRVRVENPDWQLRLVYTLAYYNVSNGYESTSYSFGFGTDLTHSNMYFENSTLVNIGDHTLWGSVSDFRNVMGRRALVISWDDIPEDVIEFKYNRYFDVASGLLLGQDYVYLSSTQELQYTKTLHSQTVLDTTTPTIDSPPDLTFEEGSTGRTITWNPSDAHLEAYNITRDEELVETDAGIWDGSAITIDVSGLNVGVYEYTCSVSDESGQSATDSVQVTVLESTTDEIVPELPIIPTNKFIIYDGKIMYELEFSLHINDTESDIEWEIRDKITEVVTVTSISSNTVRFSSEVTIKIINAYQIVGGTKYDPESYGFEYRDADNNLLEWFDDTDTHTATFVRDVSKTTGMVVRLENPFSLQYLDAIAYYDVSGGVPVTWYPHMYQIALEHASMYCENSTSVRIGDHTMWRTVTNFTTMMGRRAFVATREDIPEDSMEYMDKVTYDVASGLLLGWDLVYRTSDLDWRITGGLNSQTVLDTTTPMIDHPNDITFEEGAAGQKITWNPSDARPDAYSIIRQDKVFVEAGSWNGSAITIDVSALSAGYYEYICYVNDESGQMAMDSVRVTVVTTDGGSKEDGLIPGFLIFPTLFGLAVLILATRRSKK